MNYLIVMPTIKKYGFSLNVLVTLNVPPKVLQCILLRWYLLLYIVPSAQVERHTKFPIDDLILQYMSYAMLQMVLELLYLR